MQNDAFHDSLFTVPYSLIERSSGRVIVRHLELADRSWSRCLGWQLRRRPADDCGLLIVPCRSVHTCFVRFPLDIVGLDASGRVASLHRNLRPWRAAWCPGSVHAVLELPASAELALNVGDRLQAVPMVPAQQPAVLESLRFLTS